MKYNQLSNSTLYISEIGFGCMSLAGRDEENARMLHTALESGINFFDTADLYNKGMNELSVGKALKSSRKKIVLATKVGNQWRADGTGWDWNPHKDYILNAVEGSLKRLQTDYIDLYQLHGGTIDDPIDETIEALELLKKQGKIRYYGISSIRPNIIREFIQRSSIISVMMQYSLLDRRPEESCLPLLKENNIGVIVRGSISQGLLVNKPAKEYLGYSVQEVEGAAKAVKDVSRENRIPSQTAVKFVLSNPAVSSAVVGIRTENQLEEALKIPDTPNLSDRELTSLLSAVTPKRYEQHL